MMMAALTIISFSANAQFNSIKNTVKNSADKVKIGKGKKDKDKDENNDAEDATEVETPTDETTAETVTETVAAPTMKDGTGYFYNTYSSDDFVSQANVGDELYVRMNFGKTMNEFHEQFGLDVSHYSYGWINIYINGKLVKEIGELSFASNYSKVWTYIDLPLLVRPEFLEEIQADQSAIETGQDVWVFQQLFNEAGIAQQYTIAAIQNMKDGKNTLKIEFGVANKGDEKMAGVISTAEIEIIVDEAGKKELYKSGPKNMRPLEDNEAGAFKYSANNFTIGTGSLSTTLELPFEPKYYNMKWCKSMSCDYDHGNLNFVAFIDGEAFSFWSYTFWNDEYEVKKSFNMTVLPQNDTEIYDGFSALNTESELNKESNTIVYALFDYIYNGKLEAGNHKLTIKCYSTECVPLNYTFENNTNYFNQWPSIAETSVDLNVTTEVINKIIAASSAKKLSHAGGEWAAVDSHLKSSMAGGSPGIEIIDVAVQTEWKVTLDYYGTPMYRDCKADVIYNSDKDGCRLLKSVSIREDYNGSGYGKPYANETMSTYFFSGTTLLNNMHVPMPLSRVK